MGSGKMEKVAIDDRGRILVPKEVRERLGLRPGSDASYEVKDNRLVIIPPVTPERFREVLEGCITGDQPRIDPLKLKEIWEKPVKRQGK
jgi:AbrB family looped-hinge helix DNA binding protein